MLQLKIDVEKDLVVLDFGSPGQQLPLDPLIVEQVCDAITEKANEAEEWVKAGGSQSLRVRPTGVGVQGRDGKVWLLFEKRTAYEKIPYQAARNLVTAMLECVQEVLSLEAKILAERFNL